jgi:YHYH protein
MSNVNPQTLAVTSVSSNPTSDFYNGITTSSTYYKLGSVFNFLTTSPYYGSKTTIGVDGSNNMIVATDGDPYPALSGDGASVYTSETMTNTNERGWYDDPNVIKEQSNTYKFTYRGGTNVSNPSSFSSSTSIQGIFLNGVALFSPNGQSSIPCMPYSQYSQTTSPNYPSTKMSDYNFNAYYIYLFLGKDKATGHPENSNNVYHYHTGAFLYNGWNTPKFYNSNIYFSTDSYQGPDIANYGYLNNRPSGITTTTDFMRHVDGHSKIVGFCFDGYPIYGPFGYTDGNSASGGISRMASSYVLRTLNSDGYYADTSTDSYGQRPYSISYSVDFTQPETDSSSTSYYVNMTNSANPYWIANTKTTAFYNLYQLQGHKHGYYYTPGGLTTLTLGEGCYINDYVYKSGQTGSGVVYLDQYNGRYTKTPEYPNGTYAYFLTFTDNTLATPAYPYIIGNSSYNQRTVTTTNSSSSLSNSQISNLTPTQTTNLPDLTQVPTSTISQYTSNQVNSLNTTQLGSLSATQVNALSSSAVSGMTVTTLSSISTNTISSISTNTFNNLSQSTIIGSSSTPIGINQ